MLVRRKRFFEVIATVFAVVGIALSYVFYFYLSRNLVEVKAIRVSMQSPVVQGFVRANYPYAKARVSKLFITGDGIVYSVDDNWELIRKEGIATNKPIDGKDHYCWKVRWYETDPTIISLITISVKVDRDSWEIVSVDISW